MTNKLPTIKDFDPVTRQTVQVFIKRWNKDGFLSYTFMMFDGTIDKWVEIEMSFVDVLEHYELVHRSHCKGNYFEIWQTMNSLPGCQNKTCRMCDECVHEKIK